MAIWGQGVLGWVIWKGRGQLTFNAPCCNQIRIRYFLKVSVNQSTNEGNKWELGTDQQQHTCFPRCFNHLVKGVVNL